MKNAPQEVQKRRGFFMVNVEGDVKGHGVFVSRLSLVARQCAVGVPLTIMPRRGNVQGSRAGEAGAQRRLEDEERRYWRRYQGARDASPQRREQRQGDEAITYGVLDPRCFANEGGTPIAEAIFKGGAMFRQADNARVKEFGAASG